MLACLPVLLFAIMESPPSPRTAYLHLADAVEANFREHVLGRWYPRSVDPGGHGFRQNYNEDWSPGEPSERSIVYQSRLTWVAAMAAMRYPKERSSYLRYARAGVKELGRFWDTRDGGFYWAGTASGFPDRDKHVYGIAYAIYASATAYRATHDPGDLALAERGFRWLETHAHDPAHGGYYEALDPEGNPILGPDDTYRMDWPHRAGTDQIGTVFGLKSMNTHIHLLEALTALQEVWPDKLVRQRLAEVFGIVRDKVAAPGGYLHMFFKPDWTPVGDEDSYGHDIETAYLLVEGAAALGKSGDAKTWAIAKKIADHTLAVGWDKRYGGVYDHGGRSSGPSSPEGSRKVWWVQAEALNCFLLMHERYGKRDHSYWNASVREWEFINLFQLDRSHKGWYRQVSRDGMPVPGATKSDGWTEAYHQGRALMNVADRLRKLAG